MGRNHGPSGEDHPGHSGPSGCAEAIERLYIYLDGELDRPRWLAIKRHLDECPPCLEAFDFETELRLLISRKCREQAPTTLRARISQVVQQEFGPSELGGPEFGRSAWQPPRRGRQL